MKTYRVTAPEALASLAATPWAGRLLAVGHALLGPIALFGLWWWAAEADLVSDKLLPGPWPTLVSLWESIWQGDMVRDFAFTLYRTAYAFAIATVLGVLLGAKVLVLPLHAPLPTWLPDRHEAAAGLAAGERALQWLSDISRRYGCLTVLPRIAQREGALVSEAVLLGLDGNVLGRQTQVHPEPELAPWTRPGEDFSVFDTPFGRLGVLLGYDGLFPESARVLALKGADAIAWCAARRHPNDRRLLTVPMAEDNRCFLICANRSDAPVPGGSFVVPPTGFPQWDLDLAAPAVRRHNAVMPGFMNLALARQKSMVPQVDMMRNRLVETYRPLVSPAAASAA